MKNDWSHEIGVWIAKEERVSFTMFHFFKSKIVTTIVRVTLDYEHKHIEDLERWPDQKLHKRSEGPMAWHIMRGNNNNIVKEVISWKLTRKRPRRRSRKRWMDVIEKDLERIGMTNWRNIIQNREKWREIVMTAKTFVE